MTAADLTPPAFLDRRHRPVTGGGAPSSGAEREGHKRDVSEPDVGTSCVSTEALPLRSSGPPPPVTGEAHDPPYSPAILAKLSVALGELAGWDTPAGLAYAGLAADLLLAHGLALVEPSRARMWIDERVYSGALFRLRLAEQPPSITLHQDVFP